MRLLNKTNDEKFPFIEISRFIESNTIQEIINNDTNKFYNFLEEISILFNLKCFQKFF